MKRVYLLLFICEGAMPMFDFYLYLIDKIINISTMSMITA